MSTETIVNEFEWMATELVAHKNNYTDGSSFFLAATVERNITGKGQEVLLTFDNSKTSADGKKRAGKLLVEINNADNNILISPENYIVSGAAIKGTYSFVRRDK